MEPHQIFNERIKELEEMVKELEAKINQIINAPNLPPVPYVYNGGASSQ